MNGVLAQSWTELFQLQLLATRFATERVIVIARFLANEMNDFFLSFTLSHNSSSFVYLTQLS
jgi:hypothetical protein